MTLDLSHSGLAECLSSETAETLLLNHQLRCKSSFLPNLQTLKLRALIPSDAALHILLLGPRPHTLKAYGGTDRSFNFKSFRLVLKQQSPWIRELALSNYFRNAAGPELVEALRSLPRLERVSFAGFIGPRFNLMVGVSQLENLERLEISDMEVEDYGPSLVDPRELEDMPAAPTSLKIPGRWCTYAFLTPQLAGHRLIDLQIKAEYPRESLQSEVNRIVEVIGSTCRQVQCLTLWVYGIGPVIPPELQEVATSTATVSMAPLLELRNLRSLEFSDACNVLMPSWDGCKPSAWPDLSAFWWKSAATNNQSTLASLAIFADCKKLGILKFPVDTAAAYEQDVLTVFKSTEVLFDVGDWVMVPGTLAPVVGALVRILRRERRAHLFMGCKEGELFLWAEAEQKVMSLLRTRCA